MKCFLFALLQFIGMTGLSLIVLNPADRHMILDPLEKLEMKTLPYDAVGDTLQLLIGTEYYLVNLMYPNLSLFCSLKLYCSRSQLVSFDIFHFRSNFKIVGKNYQGSGSPEYG